MTSSTSLVVTQMQSLIDQWENVADQRAIFLSCYLLMTRNTLSAICAREFQDPPWVDRLLHQFADYYFVALEAYDQNRAEAPAVWQMVHDLTAKPHVLPIQKLLLGVVAHINYDLVLTLVDILDPEWNGLSDRQRAARYADHCHVNDVIGRTIDAVQDKVLERAMPSMDIVDRLMGPVDEFLVSRLIMDWRESVWQHAVHMLAVPAGEERARLSQKVEADALKLGLVIAS